MFNMLKNTKRRCRLASFKSRLFLHKKQRELKESLKHIRAKPRLLFFYANNLINERTFLFLKMLTSVLAFCYVTLFLSQKAKTYLKKQNKKTITIHKMAHLSKK